jgi:hypothetical protein
VNETDRINALMLESEILRSALILVNRGQFFPLSFVAWDCLGHQGAGVVNKFSDGSPFIEITQEAAFVGETIFGVMNGATSTAWFRSARERVRAA